MRWKDLLVVAALTLAIAEAKPGVESACPRPPIVVEALRPVDTSRPDHVIGSGDPASVTAAALQQALDAGGGLIVFATGGRPVTLVVAKQLVLPHGAKPTVIDGMGLVTLDGGGASGILLKGVDTDLTVQRLRFQHARVAHEGAAIAVDRWFGRLTVIDCTFDDCKTTMAGPDLGGGAFRSPGQKHVQVSGCRFNDCAGANGGAICSLGSQLTIVDCTFTNNVAFGTGGGAERGAVGLGGIGGAVYVDGCDLVAEKKQIVVERCLFTGNRAGDHAGAMFGYTRPGLGSLCVYDACVFTGNEVTAAPGSGRGLCGALYSQYCDLWITNCTIAGNHAPLMAGGLFDPFLVSAHLLNDEFYDNGAEYAQRPDAQRDGTTYARREHPPAVDAIGHAPGAPTRPEPATARKPAAPPAASVAVARRTRQVDPAAIADAEQRLQERLLAVGGRRHPHFALSAMRQEVSVEAADTTGLTLALPGAGSALTVPWRSLTGDDRRHLAEALAQGGSEEDHATAAWLLLAAGEDARVEEQLHWAGEAGRAIADLLAPTVATTAR